MSRPLLPEILDLIIDHLHNERTTLKGCCTVSKSWVPRARKHLFARLAFGTFESRIESWMKAFPDPSNSPAHHARTLMIIGVHLATAASTNVGRWIQSFRSITHLHVDIIADYDDGDRLVSLVPFHGLSPSPRWLHLYLTSIPLNNVFAYQLQDANLCEGLLIQTGQRGCSKLPRPQACERPQGVPFRILA